MTFVWSSGPPGPPAEPVREVGRGLVAVGGALGVGKLASLVSPHLGFGALDNSSLLAHGGDVAAFCCPLGAQLVFPGTWQRDTAVAVVGAVVAYTGGDVRALWVLGVALAGGASASRLATWVRGTPPG